jgi:hypothetical protein
MRLITGRAQAVSCITGFIAGTACDSFHPGPRISIHENAVVSRAVLGPKCARPLSVFISADDTVYPNADGRVGGVSNFPL